MGEIILFPVLIISFSVFNSFFNSLVSMEKMLQTECFDQRPRSGRNNSVSCLDNSISRLENLFRTPW